MLAGQGGWWKSEKPVFHGQDYWFLVDGQGPFPDPRSPWQPSGIDGPSRRMDHNRFVWTDTGWQAPPLSSAIIYELHVGTFTPEGTFKAVIHKLDHLLELGITHIELMPAAEFSGKRGWGYDGVDLYAPHHAYGPPHDLKQLVDACHSRGLAVILDVVYNHLGPAGNYLSRFGPYFTDRYQTPWGEAVNFDGPGSHEVRRFFIDNALMWLKCYHFDGLRLDAVHAMLDTSAVHFLEQLAREVKSLEAALGRHLVLIAESDLNDPRLVRPAEAGGYGLDAQWNEDFHHALHALLTGERQGYYADFGQPEQLAKVLEHNFVLDGAYSVFRNRPHGRPASDLCAHRFVACLQNHDQVGNRAFGRRTSHLLSADKLKMGAALVLTSPFVPLLFQGEEWAAETPFLYFSAHEDPDLAEAVRQGRRREFASFDWPEDSIPDPQAESSHESSRLNWRELSAAEHQEIFDWHKKLIHLRRNTPDLNSACLEKPRVRTDPGKKSMIIYRGAVIIVCSFCHKQQTIELPAVKPNRQIILASHEKARICKNYLDLPPWSLAILW